MWRAARNASRDREPCRGSSCEKGTFGNRLHLFETMGSSISRRRDRLVRRLRVAGGDFQRGNLDDNQAELKWPELDRAASRVPAKKSI
ncbi:hypothetical protein Anapl_00510 [Anas platyrhynchos]|uniref:Uncharacterized protein n=1 Tax=Anas platyrhynchos TaxID=8839 RepID=R0JU35_ANAPL|nr:hypothetical protein Anapl_00510 [Anas platyrhynchos]